MHPSTVMRLASLGMPYVRLEDMMPRPKLNKKCTVDDCERKHWAKGYCKKHYKRLWRNGTTQPIKIHGNDTRRFHSKYIAVPECGCWLWEGTLVGEYGQLDINGENVLAHRYSWELHNGPIPDGMLVCHKCDTPSCVNPNHLFMGTQKDNMADAVKKGRIDYKELSKLGAVARWKPEAKP